MRDAEDYKKLGKETEWATSVFRAGRELCEALWTLDADDDFYKKVKALAQLSAKDLQQAKMLIDDEPRFERFLQTISALLEIAGMEHGQAEQLVKQCQLKLKDRGDLSPLTPRAFRNHVRRLRDHTCGVAEGELSDRVKRLERERHFKSSAFAVGATAIKASATVAVVSANLSRHSGTACRRLSGSGWS
jgi:hypothetical protein